MIMEEYTMGYINDTFDVAIKINLENGIYQFTPDSSTGKTFLANKLKKYGDLGEPVTSVTYRDVEKNHIEIDSNKDYAVILFDRYDLYSDKITDLITSLGKKSIVLVDSKIPLIIPWTPIGYCTIQFSPSKIEVN